MEAWGFCAVLEGFCGLCAQKDSAEGGRPSVSGPWKCGFQDEFPRAGEFAAGRNLGAFCVFECGFYAFCCQNFFYMLL